MTGISATHALGFGAAPGSSRSLGAAVLHVSVPTVGDSAVAALDAVVAKLAAHGIDATLVGLNEHSAELHGRTTGSLTSSH